MQSPCESCCNSVMGRDADIIGCKLFNRLLLGCPSLSWVAAWVVLHVTHLIVVIDCEYLYPLLWRRGYHWFVFWDRIKSAWLWISWDLIWSCRYLFEALSCCWFSLTFTHGSLTHGFYWFIDPFWCLDSFVLRSIQSFLAELAMNSFQAIDKTP